MQKFYSNIALYGALGFLFGFALPVQGAEYKGEETYKVNHDMYKDGWIDFNKNGKKDVYEDTKAKLEDRIEDLLSQMNIEEKTCQMVTLYGYGRVLKDDLPKPEWKKMLWKDGMGAIDEHLNGFRQWGLTPSENPNVWPASRHAWAMNEVQRFFVEDTRLGIPTDFTNEGIRGVEAFKATNFPTQLGIGHTWNRQLVEKVGEITGREGRLLGYTNVYAPILDVGRDQRWGRYEEIYGEDPFLVAELGVAMTRGMQKDMQVAATAKHYIAYSNNKAAREGMARVDPQMSPREVEMIHVYPWKRVIKEAGLLGAMSSYNDYDAEPIQSSKYWLTDRLRGEMGFKGYVVSDSDAVEYLYMKHRTAKDMKESVLQSVMAGLNVRCTFRSPDSYVEPLRELVKEGKIPMSVIDDRVRDILRVKFMIGMFDDPYQRDLQAADKEVDSPENQAVALQASRESLVLLKNDKKTLPLNKDALKKVAVIGPNAKETSFALTHYGPLAVEVFSVYDGLKEKLGDKVSYALGCDLVDPNWPESELMDFPMEESETAKINEAVALAQDSDVAVVVLGGGVRTCGENKSRSSLDLPGRQEKLLQAVAATGKPVILVLINGRPQSINWAEKNIPAILETWYPGSQGGKAIADVLMGDYNPGGKLTVTVPKSVGQIPLHFPYRPNSQVDGGGKKGLNGNMSRVNGALYDFGHGLSYTTFAYSNLKLSEKQVKDTDTVTISFDVKNTGDRAGDEVVQLYVQDKISSVTTYDKILKGFDRIHLKPGETQTVTMTLPIQELKLLNKDKKWVVEPGEFDIMVGASSRKILLKDKITVGDVAQTSDSLDNVLTVSTPIKDKKIFIDGKNDAMWSAKSGDHVTFALKEGTSPKQINVSWAPGTQCKFTIQLSSGGGQFLDIKSDSATTDSNAQEKTYTFDGSLSSDIRLIITEGKAQISEIQVPGFKGE